jgi:hypothetical protein
MLVILWFVAWIIHMDGRRPERPFAPAESEEIRFGFLLRKW